MKTPLGSTVKSIILLAMGPWTSYTALQGLSFTFYKMDVVMASRI